ncbi:alpha/beta fold hydrolase [uncultured Ilumatobacter sp.]|jgi:3-oxoadipate enol-lactonase|uniref:alpha/beta fold hydrolase n=1 Tax=uncultured Ilumatobacter sp. TaxID=879968 RepID=UPI00374F4E39
MPHAQINGQSIYFQDTGGDGPPVILAHGFLMDNEMFAPQVAALRETHRVITWDERGFGQTEFDGQPFSYWDSAADCLALLDHLGIHRAVVGGMSQGGFLSLRLALTAPDRVRGLILLDTQAGVDDAETKAANDGMNHVWLTDGPESGLADIVASIIIDDPDHSPAWIAKWISRPKEAFAQPYQCLSTRDDITDRLGEITCPAVVVHGIEDTAITMDRAEILADGLVGCSGVVKVRGAHAANLTNPEPVNLAIVEFLAGLAA